MAYPDPKLFLHCHETLSARVFMPQGCWTMGTSSPFQDACNKAAMPEARRGTCLI